MKRLLRRVGLPVIVAAAVIAAYLVAKSRPVQVETARVARGPVEQYVTEEATTRLHAARAVTALTFGIAARIELEEGDQVKAGQLITTIRDTQLQALLQRAQAQVRETQGYLEGTTAPLPEKSEIEAAQKRAESAALAVEVARKNAEVAEQNQVLAHKELERTEALAARGVVPEETLDRVTTNYEVARRELAAAELRVQVAEIEQKVAALQEQVLLESMDDTEYLEKVYGARIEQIGAEVALLEEERIKTEVRSPMDGVILAKHVDREGYVSPGTDLLLVGDMNSIEIESDILSDDIPEVRVGQNVRLEGKALSGTPAVGTVKKIYPAGSTKVSALGVRQQRVKVLIDFDNSQVLLGPGYGLDIKIITDWRDDAVLAPAGAVFATAEGMAAFKVSGGRAVLTPLGIGIRGEDHWEVLSGLEPGDTVIVHPPADLEPGARVAAP